MKRQKDINCAGGAIRPIMKRHRGQYDAGYELLDMSTGKPHTNQSLKAALEVRKNEYPEMTQMIEAVLAGELTKKAEHHPTAVYKLSRRATTEEAARASAEKMLFPRAEAIARLLYRPQWESNLEAGRVTVLEFVRYMGDRLFTDAAGDTRAHLMASVRQVIVPAIGDIRLVDLDPEKAIKKINRVLKSSKAQESKRGYTRRAYKGMMQAIRSSGYAELSSSARLADLIMTTSTRRNRALLDSCRIGHLDEATRSGMFRLLEEERYAYERLLIALVYCGLDEAEMAAVKYGDIVELLLRDESCYVITVSRMAHRAPKRCTKVSASNDAFPPRRLRKVVLYPWAATALDQYIQNLREKGYTDTQIAGTYLSARTPDSVVLDPSEVIAQIESLLRLAEVPEVHVPRVKNTGEVYVQTIPPDLELLRRDAKYVAGCCGADQAMLHAMFGDNWSEMDERSYLDLLGDDYAVARYLRLRRFAPDQPQRRIYRIRNQSQQPQTLRIESDYVIHVTWKEYE